VGLSIGESFAEARIDGSSGFLRASRWPLLRKSAAEGLQELLKAAGIDPAESPGSLHVATAVRDKTLARRQGQTPAVLVTAGFESWIKTQLPDASPVFSLEPKRAWAPIEDDFIFGVAGRVDVDGKINAPLGTEEIDFLVAKLEMSKSRQIAVAFLHAKKNPRLEIEAKELLAARGFQVFMSHEQSGATETERWLQAIEAAYCDLSFREEAAALASALPGWTIEHTAGLGDSLKRSRETTGPIAVHLGLEQFNLLEKTHAGWSERRLSVSATQEIVAGPWPHPEISRHEMSGFEPGPMLLGKSQTLTILDVLFVRDRLTSTTLEALTSTISEKSRPRIWEAILTLGRSASGGAKVDERLLAEDLETLFVDRLALALTPALMNLGSRTSARIELDGALAGVFSPLLSKRRPDLDFTVAKESEFALAGAALGGAK
jgi:hypothetical protein